MNVSLYISLTRLHLPLFYEERHRDKRDNFIQLFEHFYIIKIKSTRFMTINFIYKNIRRKDMKKKEKKIIFIYIEHQQLQQ